MPNVIHKKRLTRFYKTQGVFIHYHFVFFICLLNLDFQLQKASILINFKNEYSTPTLH